ncbi:MAG: DUF2436 domain-containing protein [Lentimicrobiaceae bacterium]|nr:DUF2436 domain-containing protein [Lentimicrobiaceae bacterium]
MKKILFFLLSMCSMIAMGQISNFETTSKSKNNLSIEQLRGHSAMSYELMRYHANQPKLQVYKSKSEVPSDKAEVILEAHKVFGEFAQLGFQMLIDADADSYDNLFYEWSSAYYDTYDAFEYKIPENADPSETSTNIVFDDAVAIQIPAGTYDFMILCPFPGDGLIFTNGEYAKVNDFEFQGGNTYRFVIEYAENEYGFNVDMAFLYVDIDAAITNIIVPANSMDLTNSEEISVEIHNRGISAISNFNVSYQIDYDETFTETYSETIEAGEKATYTFATKADLSVEKQYIINAWVSLEDDMISSNDQKSTKCKHIGVSPLPFTYDFSDYGAEGIESDWIVEDVNEDDSYWQYNEWTEDVNGGMGAVSCSGSWAGDRTGNDNLISAPIQLPAGDVHLTFYSRCINGDDATELLDVRYGTTTNVDEMTIIGDYAINQNEWVKRIINFEVENEGVYYFAFHVKSVNGMNVFIDELTIDVGVMEVSPLLEIQQVVLPYSNCDLSDASLIGAKIKNTGTGPTSTFTMTYKVNDGVVVTEEFEEIIQPTESAVVYFNTTTDFSEVGEYVVEVTATASEETESTLTGTVNNYEPISNLPIMTDFVNKENYSEYWTETNEIAWFTDEWTGMFGTDQTGVENALITRCLYLENSVRIKLQYSKGGWETSRMYVTMGKSGDDISDFVKVYENENIEGDTEVEFVVNITEADNYNFAIVNESDEYCNLYLYTCTISELLQHDLRVEDVTYPAAPYTPQLQLTGEGEYFVTVTNRGTDEMTKVKAALYEGETLLGESDFNTNIASDKKEVITLKAKLPEKNIGDQINLTVKVTASEDDDYSEDNTFEIRTINVTEDVYATENIEVIETGTGNWGSQLFVGNIYTLTVSDILESVTIGLAHSSAEDIEMATKLIGLSIYAIEDELKLGQLVAHTEFERGFGGFTEITLDPMKLSPGMYYFEVQQLSTYNMGLAVDPYDLENSCYQRIDNDLNKILGPALSIRANFNSELTVYEKDAAAIEFVAPKKEATLFTENETISVLVKNKGSETADIPVRLTVNTIDFDTEVTLNPYEEKVVDFENVNMKEVGEYVVLAQTLLEGDENEDNNGITKTFTSVEEANPYIMDFESCYDFDAAPDVFNPRWTTVDRNGKPTDYFWMFEHQYRGEGVGFIAFNPESTKPAMTEELLPGFTPHSGKRFGAAFCVGYDAEEMISDVWLMSPKLKLGDESSLELYVKTRILESAEQELEKYRILISDTNNDFDSFVVLGDDVREAALEWEKVEFDLADYNNKEVYVAIQYIGEKFKNVCLMVDDIKVDTKLTDRLETLSSKDINIFHSQNTLTVKSEVKIDCIEIVNIHGQIVEKKTNLGSGDINISTENYVSGVYITKVYRDKASSKTMKFVVR